MNKMSLFEQSPLQKSVTLAFSLFSALAFLGYTLYLLINRQYAFEDSLTLLVAPGVVTLSIIVALLCFRRPENTISWLLMIVALMIQTNYFEALRTIVILEGQKPGLGLVLLGNLWPWLSGLSFTILAYVFILFPTGQLPSPRWRPVVWLLVLQILIHIVRSVYLTYDLSQAYSLARQGLVNIALIPLAETGPSSQILHSRPLPGMAQLTYWIALIALVMVLLGLWSLIGRFRHGTTLERQQVKWLIFALVIWVIAIVLIIGDFGVPVVAFSLIVPLISMSIGIAILRYRLWDIDIIIRRTLTYGALTAILAGVYFGSVILLQALFRPLTGDSPLAIVVSTLLIAALFTPLRNRLQAFIDRHFYRRKYNAAHALEAFARTARDEVELEALADELIQVVAETLQPESLSLWLKESVANQPHLTPVDERQASTGSPDNTKIRPLV